MDKNCVRNLSNVQKRKTILYSSLGNNKGCPKECVFLLFSTKVFLSLFLASFRFYSVNGKAELGWS